MSVMDYIKDLFDHPERYAKFWIALGTAILNLLSVYFPDQPWLPVVVSLAGALGVITVPNKSKL